MIHMFQYHGVFIYFDEIFTWTRNCVSEKAKHFLNEETKSKNRGE